ncbi:Iron-sulfur assembly protein 2 [Nakaseomyces bracarensis]|uniref:Iron-sulfur assembly protein 2 n=1 Tax=Nakaseomyces bracarensis TaxID=273131 RepID=A0ABR4NMK4_9SACH
MLGSVARHGFRALPMSRPATRVLTYGGRSLFNQQKHALVTNMISISYRRYAIKVEQSTNEVTIIEPVKVLNKPEGKQLKIDERAAQRLNDIYSDSKEVLRILVESGGCHGFQYNMKLVPESCINLSEGATKDAGQETTEADEFDEDGAGTAKDVIFVVSENGGKVVIDETSLGILNNTTLKYTTELIGSTFKITDGNLKSSCGCGSSFDIEDDK